MEGLIGLIGGLEGNFSRIIGIQLMSYVMLCNVYQKNGEKMTSMYNQERNVRMKVKIGKHGHCSNIIKYLDTVQAVSVFLGASMFCGYVYIEMQHYSMVDVHIDREVS